MGHPGQDHIIVVGCGRVGAELALSIARQKHAVAVVDINPRTFDRLGANFRGKTVQGEGFDRDVLMRAGIETAHALAAVTASDSANIITARIARDLYHVPHVVARVYNPRRAPIYEKLSLQTVASSSWGAQRIEQLILHPGLQSVYTAGNGEVQVYEVRVTDEWEGKPLGELVPAVDAAPVALTHGGRSLLPGRDAVLHTHDLLLVSATAAGAAVLRQRIHVNGKD
jgi:trk system potassium uptake protein TrkA